MKHVKAQYAQIHWLKNRKRFAILVCVDEWGIVSHLSQLNCHFISMSSHSLQ